jgi:hypothetical protein
LRNFRLVIDTFRPITDSSRRSRTTASWRWKCS